MNLTTGRWEKIPEIGERLDYIGEPDEKGKPLTGIEKEPPAKAFIDFRGVDLTTHFNPAELKALEHACNSMNTDGEESAVMARRIFWLCIRFLPLLIIFLIITLYELQCQGCAGQTVFRPM